MPKISLKNYDGQKLDKNDFIGNILFSEEIDLNLRGMLITLLCNDNTDVLIKDLKTCKIGEAIIKSSLDKLQKLGYITLEKSKNRLVTKLKGFDGYSFTNSILGCSVNDKEISLKARGMFVTLLYHSNQNILIENLRTKNIGMTIMRSSMNELQELGYVTIRKNLKENRKGFEYSYVLDNKIKKS